MKLHQENNVVERSGTGNEQAFTIKATSKAFAILSSGLYSDKIGAIVRELSCNAYDAHVAAGTQATPIQIQLPTPLNPQFQVKDFGVGLNDEGIMKLYTTYFESTKADSDDFIGALGLGSKSPFSYTDSFLVESRYNGTKRLYTSFISENGVPAITGMGSQETNEPNGLTITIAVKHVDINTFVNAAKRQLMYFSPMPKIVGDPDFVPHKVQYDLEGTNWKVRNDRASQARFSGPRVVQGFVSYPVDFDQLAKFDTTGKLKNFAKINLDLYVTMGQVEVAASREALSYDNRTATNLVANLETAAGEMAVTIQKDFDACATFWDASKLFTKLNEGSEHEMRIAFDALHMQKRFSYQGRLLSSEMLINTIGITSTVLVVGSIAYNRERLSIDQKWTPASTSSDQFIVRPRKDMVVLIDDMWHNANNIAYQYLQAQSDKRDLLLIRTTAKSTFNQVEIDGILAQLDCKSAVRLSTLNIQATKKVSTYVKREKDMRLQWKGFSSGPKNRGVRRTFSRLCWNGVNVDLSAGGFYVPIERFTIVDESTPVVHFDDIVSSACDVGLITEADLGNTFGFTEKEINSAPRNWVNLFDHIRAQYVLKNANNAIINVITLSFIQDHIGRGATREVLDRWATISGHVQEGLFKTVVDKICKLYPDCGADIISVADARSFHNYFITESVTTARNIAAQLLGEWKSTINAYEMLSIVDWCMITQPQSKVVLNYVNLLEQKV